MIRRRSSLLAALVLGLLIVGAMYAVLSERRLTGEVPGRGAIRSLAISEDGFFVATSEGIFESRDGIEWERHELTGQTQVASSGSAVFASSAERLFRLDKNAVAGALTGPPSALAAEGEVAYAAVDGWIAHVPGGDAQMHDPQPRDVVALDVDQRIIYGGGISSGLWKSEDGGQEWLQLIATPTTAVMADPTRLLVGTPGGLLISESKDRLEFTELREPINGLSMFRETIYAVGERLIYRSENGKTGWEALAV